MEGQIALTRDFVKKFYQIGKSVKYDDIDFDRAEKYVRKYVRAKICEEVGHFEPNFKLVDKLNIFNLSNVLRFKCGYRIKAGFDRFNEFLKKQKKP